MQKITIVGTGYVGFSLALLLGQQHKVTAFDIDKKRVDAINQNICPLKHDQFLKEFFENNKLDICATTKKDVAYSASDFIILAVPTNFDEETNSFDTSILKSVISDIAEFNKHATIIIKSTIPIGFTEQLKKDFDNDNIFFSPEFLREGQSLFDNLYPSRIVLGSKSKAAHLFKDILIQCSKSDESKTSIIFTSSSEAEAIKLFSNSYLAMRVAFFNEIDTFCIAKKLNSEAIIQGVSLDPRIGDFYNNPSFGYGGYCLPKDTKQLLSNFGLIPSVLVKAVIESNITRKKFIANDIKTLQPNVIGIYRLTMKTGSDNFRESAIQDIIDSVASDKIKIIIYEPEIAEDNYKGYKIIKSILEFKSKADLILANRIDSELLDVLDKIYTRDIYSRD
jgi:UDPglucose 6-dehydrogenase